MAIPNPRTWIAGEVLTATLLNDELRDVADWLLPVFARKTSTESVTSSTALQDDNELSVAVEANTIYEFTSVIKYDAATAGDLKYRWVGPAGATLSFTLQRVLDSGLLFTDDQAYGGDINVDVTAGGIGAGTTAWIPMQGLLVVAGTAGTLQLRWAQNSSSGTATRLFADSYVCLRRVA